MNKPRGWRDRLRSLLSPRAEPEPQTPPGKSAPSQSSSPKATAAGQTPVPPAKAVSPREAMRARAGVVVTFDPDDLLGLGASSGDVIDFLDEECHLVPMSDGPSAWTLDDAVRTRLFASTDEAGLRKARKAVTAVPSSLVQEALDRSLQGGWSTADVRVLDDERTAALSVVSRWWNGSRRDVPSPDALADHLRRRLLLADARSMAGDHFVGRQDILAQLRAGFANPPGRPTALWGIGGIGKSALVARLVVDIADDPGPGGRRVVALLDFDDPAINPMYPAELVAVITEQLDIQTAAGSGEFANLRSRAVSESAYVVSRSGSTARKSTGPDTYWADLLAEGLDKVRGRLLVVMDTTEQAQRRGPSAMYALADVVGALCQRPNVFVLLSGRARIPELDGLVTPLELRGLAQADAVTLMVDLSGGAVDADRARALVDRFGTRHTEVGSAGPHEGPVLISPLTVRLIASLLAKTDPGSADPLFGIQAANEQLDAELYLRILDHIADPAVRALAHPGLVLRRITPEIIRDVLVKGGGLTAVGPDRRQVTAPTLVTTHGKDSKQVEVEPVRLDKLDEHDLFNRLAAEPMLVDRPEPDVLEHRQDVRAVMLPQILRDTSVDSTAIQLAAVAYYARRPDPASKVEELYHRLLLGQGRDKLDPIWDERAAEQLITAADELPQASRVFLLSKLPRAFVGDDDRRLLDDAEWLEKVEPTVEAMLSRGRPEEALALLGERRRADGGPLLPIVEIEALEALDRLDEAIELAGREKEVAATALHPVAVTDLSLQQCRLFERAGHPESSLAVLDRATAVSRARSVDRLRLLVAWLGVARRNELGTPADRQQRVDEAVAIGRTATTRRLAEYPGLLRDLAAEVGDEAGDVLDTALRSVGFDAHLSGTVPDALKDLADSPERTAQVIDLLRLGEDPREPVEWRQVVNQNRSESGLGVAEVLSAFPTDTTPLRDAVVKDYRSEADAAYRGIDQSDELRWDGPS